MTLQHGAGVPVLERLGPADLVEMFAFLDRDPVLNVYLIALALRDGLSRPHEEFWAARRDEEIVGLLHIGGPAGAVLPLGDDAAAIERLAGQMLERRALLPHRAQIIGPRPTVECFERRLRDEGVSPRLMRRQIYMALERATLPPFERLPALRLARAEDFALIYESGALLRAEELEEDPRLVDPAAYARRVEEECRDGSTWIWTDGEGLCFRASVSALTADAAQIAGVFTPPGRRNRGVARRGMSELCARLFERAGTACLFVNDFNAPAIALYRRTGFKPIAEWASVFYDSVR
jgi:ribosomal protein S18 acetylase RimI-like enzyme